MANYAELRDTLRTGDLILFSGKGRVSNIIKFFTKSEYSHVGMVIKTEMGLFLWESTTLSNCVDWETGQAHEGVQIVLLSDRLKAYDGSFAVRRVDKGLGPKAMTILHDFRKEVSGRDYETSKLELIHSALDLVPLQDENLDSLFCSELVAEFYQRAGRLPVSVSSNEYTPADFAHKLQDVFRPLEPFIYG